MNTTIQKGQQGGQLARGHAAQDSGLPVSARRESVIPSVVRIALIFLGWAAITIVAALAALPIVVSLFWGPTHLAVALLLAGAWVGLLGLLVLGVARIHLGRAVVAATMGFSLLVLATVAVSQVSAFTPPIVDAQGKPLPGSIATLEQVNVNGSAQWISIRGKSSDNPVLLWLSGGPGGSQLATARYHLEGLEEHFVVVNWEQPGAGKSYHSAAHSTLTVERFISDAHALVQHLKERFGEEKVYVVGESWGSALGIWLAQRYPNEFHALVGTGQMVDFIETDLFDYEFALRLAAERGNTKKVEELKRQGPPPYYGDGVVMKQAAYLLDGFAYMNQDPNIAQDDGFDTFKDILSPEYGLYDKVNWARGVLDSGNVIFPQLWQADVDFRRDAPSLKVPIYFLIGRHDINAPTALAEEYYKLLDAPHKELIWFERSGHNPWVTESSKFVDVVVNKLLVNTPPTPNPQISLKPCTLPGGVQAECGTLSVFEDRKAMAGRKIDLRVAVIRARSTDPLPDPVFFLAGGPGGAATEQWAGAANLFPTLHERRDFVLVDQRGTGGSNRLLCPPLPGDLFSMSEEEAAVASLEYGRACIEQLGDAVRFYTTNFAMDDLEDVREAMGYDKINLYGASYGATAAQVYLKQHEKQVRTVILDGATLLDVPVFELMGKNRQRALDLVFSRCQGDVACAAAFPNVRGEFEAVLERLRRESLTTTVTNPLTRKPVIMTAAVLHGTVNWMLFSAGQAAHLPGAIHQAYNGNFDALAQEYARSQSFSTDTLRQIMFYSIVCNEGWARWSATEVARNGAGTYFAEEEVRQARLMEEACGLVPRADLPVGFDEPVRSKVPVLLLVGEADPQDPEGNVADAPQELPNSLTVVAPGQGHTVVQYGCLPNLATAFVNGGTTTGLDTRCVEEVPVPAFKIEKSGR